MEPVNPLTTKQEFKFKIPESPDGGDVTISLVATDAGDGNEADFVVWHQPRLVAPGRPDLLLRDVRSVARELASRRDATVRAARPTYLNAADEVVVGESVAGRRQRCQKHGVERNRPAGVARLPGHRRGRRRRS